MKFSEIIDQASALLQRKGRITYRALKLEFALNDEQLDVLKEELIQAQRVAVDEDGKVLMWVGEGAKEEPENRGTGESEKRGEEQQSVQTLDARRDVGERRQLTVQFIRLYRE